MKFIITLVIAMNLSAYANTSTSLGEGEALQFETEGLVYADDDGDDQEVRCDEGKKPVIVCVGDGDNPRPKPRPNHKPRRRCRAAYRTCHDMKGEIFCVPKPRLCPKS